MWFIAFFFNFNTQPFCNLRGINNNEMYGFIC